MPFKVEKSTRNLPKVYRALLTQSGTDAPVATVLENSLGGTVVWTRTGVGDYTATLVGAFPSSKTFIPTRGYYLSPPVSDNYLVTISRSSDNAVSAFSYGAGGVEDGVITD